MTNFEQVVESKLSDSASRLSLLLKYTEGDCNDLIQGCIFDTDGKGYSRVKSLLKQRYGDPHQVLCKFTKELRSWKKYQNWGFCWAQEILYLSVENEWDCSGSVVEHVRFT